MPSIGATGGRFVAGRAARMRLLCAVALPGLAVALAGCSGFSSSPTNSAQVAPAAPPANTAMTPPPAYAASQPVAATNYTAPEAASTGVYPSVSISELFTSDSAPARTTSVPRPPVTYTASGQPYTPPAAQGPYGDAQPAVPARPAPEPSATGVYPNVSLSELFTSDSRPARTANVPRPPDTYTPSGQPYAPQAGAAPPPPNPEQSGTPYPQQTLFDVFSDRR